MSFKHIKKGLGLAALALGLMGSGAANAGFSTTEVQLHYGGGYKVGSNSTFPAFAETTNRATITLEHFSTNDIGDLFFFIDFFVDQEDEVGTNQKSDQYGEIYYTLHGKQFGIDLGDGFISALDLQFGLNQGTDFSVALVGPRVSFNVPGFQVLSLALTTYTNFNDPSPVARDLDTTYQATVVWAAPFDLGSQKFKFQGFVDFIGDQGAGLDSQVVFSPQIRWDLGHAIGRQAGKIHLGIEYTHFNNKFGLGVNENSASVFLGLRF